VEPQFDESATATDGLATPDDPLVRLRARAQQGAVKRKVRKSFWRELPLLIVIALVIAVLIKTFLVQAFFIESGSMRDTLLEGDRVMVNKLSYRFGDVDRGDIVVFDPPGGSPDEGESLPAKVLRNIAESIGLSQPASEFIKRVIALEGETIEIRNSQVFVDGTPLVETYLGDGIRMADMAPLVVPADHLFVMGDNRSSSRDSRFFGPIPTDDVVGRAFVTVWPPSRWDGL
jgi:signal peptidase I